MARKIDTDAVIEKIRLKQQFSHPSSPDSGYNWLYVVSGSAHGGLYLEDASGRKIGPFITGSAGGSGITSSFTSISPTTTNITATVTDNINYHVADVSGMTADRNFTIPAGTAGKRIVLNISVGDDAFEFIVIGDTGITINGGVAATEWSRLFITNESVELLATSSTNWQVVHDGRIPCHGQMTLSANDTTNSANTLTLPTWDNAVINVGNICDTTNYRFNIRRAGRYRVSGDYRADNTVADGNYVFVQIYLNGSGGTQVAVSDARQSGASTAMSNAVSPRSINCAVGDYLEYYYQPQAANDGISATKSFFEVIEV